MSDKQQVTLPILGMTCANCVASVERGLSKVDGVDAAVVNLSSERASVSYDPQKTISPRWWNGSAKLGTTLPSGKLRWGSLGFPTPPTARAWKKR
jgi:Cu+-exporting ATPase